MPAVAWPPTTAKRCCGFRPLTATGRSIPTVRGTLIVAAVILPCVVVQLLLQAVFGRAATAAVIGLMLLLAGSAVTRYRDLTWRPSTSTGKRLRRLAARVDVPLVLVAGLTANPNSGAAIRMLRTLRPLADLAGVGLAATARAGNSLTGYHANGFAPADSSEGDEAGFLYRPPGAPPYQPRKTQ
jgi:hypothetical protein